MLRLALALLAAFTTRLALARAAFALTLASVATSATRTFVTTGLLRLRSTLLVAPRIVAAGRLARARSRWCRCRISGQVREWRAIRRRGRVCSVVLRGHRQG